MSFSDLLAQTAAAQQGAQPQQQSAPQSHGLLGRIISGFTQPFVTTGKSFANEGKAIAGLATGNRTALNNAADAESQLGLRNIATAGAQIPLYALNPFAGGGAAAAAKGAATAADAGKLAKLATAYKASSPVTKSAVIGSAFGGLGAAGQNGAGVSDIAKGAGIGAVGGAVTGKGLSMLGKVLRPAAPVVMSGGKEIKPLVPQNQVLVNPGEAPQNISSGLPQGWTMTAQGDPVKPNGQIATLGELQVAHQAPQLPDQLQQALVNNDVQGIVNLHAQNSGNGSFIESELAKSNSPAAQQALGLIKGNAKVANIQNTASNVAPSPSSFSDNTPNTPQQPNILQKFGQALEKPAAAGTSPASPFGAVKEADINSFLKDEGLLKAGSNSQTIYEKLPAKFKEYQGQINNSLASDTSTVNPQGLIQKVGQAMGENNHFLGSDTASAQVQKNVTAAIQKAGKDGNLSAKDLYNLKGQIQDELTRAFDKAAKGAPLTGGEDALMSARNAINDFMPAEAKALGKKESMLYDAAVGLNKARKTEARLPSLAGLVLPHYKSTAAVHAAQSLGTAIGAPIEAAGNIAQAGGNALRSAVSKVPEPIQNAVAGVAEHTAIPAVVSPMAQAATQPPTSPDAGTNPLNAQAGMGPYHSVEELQAAAQRYAQNPQAPEFIGVDPAIFGYPADQTAQPPDQVEQAPTTAENGLSSQRIESAMLADLAQTGGKNFSKLNTLYSIVSSQEKAALAAQQAQNKPLTSGAASQVQSAQQAMSGLQAIQAAFNGTRSTGAGLFSKVLSKKPLGIGLPGSEGVQNVNAAIQVALPDIAKALGYGTSKAELSALLDQLPSTSDTQKSAQVKLSKISDKIQTFMHQYLSTQANYVQPNNNNLDQLLNSGVGDLSGVGA